MIAKKHAILNVPRVGREAYVRQPQEGACADGIDLQAITILQLYDRDQAFQRRLDHPWPLKTEGAGLDLAGHEKEHPSRGSEFRFELLAVRIVRDPSPAALGYTAFEA